MTGVLILAHGSREKETEITLKMIVELTKEALGMQMIETATLKFSETDLKTGLLNLMDEGATDIIVIPYFLFEGVHMKVEIPNEINIFSKEYPNVKITLGCALGTDRRLSEIIADRVRALI